MKSQGWFQRTHNTSNQTENMLYKGSVSWTQSNIFHLSLPKQNKNKIKKNIPKTGTQKQETRNKQPTTKNKPKGKTSKGNNTKRKQQNETQGSYHVHASCPLRAPALLGWESLMQMSLGGSLQGLQPQVVTGWSWGPMAVLHTAEWMCRPTDGHTPGFMGWAGSEAW